MAAKKDQDKLTKRYEPSPIDVATTVSWMIALPEVTGARRPSHLDQGELLLVPLYDVVDRALRSRRGSRRLVPPRLARLQSFRNSDRRQAAIAAAIREEPQQVWINHQLSVWAEDHSDLKDLLLNGEVFDGIREELENDDQSKLHPAEFISMIHVLGLTDSPAWKAVLTSAFAIVGSSVPNVIAPSTRQDPNMAKTLERTRRKFAATRASVDELEDQLKSSGSREVALSDDFTELQAQLNKKGNDLSDSMDRFEVLERQVRRKDSRIATLRDRVKERDSELSKAIREKDALVDAIDESTTKLTNITADVETFKATITKNEREISELGSYVENGPATPRAIEAFIDLTLDEVEVRRDTTVGPEHERLEERSVELRSMRSSFQGLYPDLGKPKQVRQVTQPAASLTFSAIGGGLEIGASMYQLTIGDDSLLIDAGIRPNSGIDDLGPNTERWTDIDPDWNSLVVTHAHNDHAGWLPAMYYAFRDLEIYTTPQTNELLEVMLPDSYRQMQRLLQGAAVRAKYDDGVVPAAPYYEGDVEGVLNLISTVPFGQQVSLSSDMSFQMMPAGHILGAASLLVEAHGRRVVITGDYSTFDQETVKGADWSAAIGGPIDLVVTEATYGVPRSKTRSEITDGLLARVADTLERKAVVLIPSFALGRAQEVLTILQRGFTNGTLPKSTVWIDGLIQQINPVYRKYTPLALDDNFIQVRDSGDEKVDVLRKLELEGGIIVTTSGMMNGGPIVDYARYLLGDPRNVIIFVGYQSYGTPGHYLQGLHRRNQYDKTLRLVDRDGEAIAIQVRAAIDIFPLSAHSDAEEMATIIGTLNPKTVAIVHGDQGNRDYLSSYLRDRGINAVSQNTVTMPANGLE